MNSWIQGILTSLAGGIIFLLIEKLFSTILIPKWKGSLMKVPNVSGVWEGYDLSPENQKPFKSSRLEIKQTGTKIIGVSIRNSQEKKRERVFNYEGFINSGQVVVTFEEAEGTGYIVGSMVLILSSDLNEFKGKTTYYHHELGKVVSREKLYKRKR